MLDAGFLEEAEDLFDRGVSEKDVHKNVDTTLSRIKGTPDEEDKKESAAFEKVRPISEFYRQFGRALVMPLPTLDDAQWKGPNCTLELSLTGTELIATGSYEVRSLGLLQTALMSAGPASGMVDAPPWRYQVEYRSSGRGRAFLGTIVRKRDGEVLKKDSGTLSDTEQNPTVLMILSDDGREIRVLERTPERSTRFYEFTRI